MVPNMNNKQRRKSGSRRRGCAVTAVILLAAFLLGVWGMTAGHLSGYLKGISSISGETGETAFPLEGLYSPHAVLAELETGGILAGKGEKERIYPASLTKIMTAILVIEGAEDLDRTVRLPEEIFPPLYEAEASMAGFAPGEEATLSDLVYGMLLPSGAECCQAAARKTAGSEQAFVERMNEKASELGMKNTHFCNTTGLHDKNHYSTAEDIAILLRYALDNPAFREIFCAKRHSVKPTLQHPEGFTFYSSMFSLLDSLDNRGIAGGELLGGKTGYTAEAGLCLASLATVDGKEYILVTAGAKGSHQTPPFNLLDALTVYNRL